MSVGHCALPPSGEPFSGASHEQVIYLFYKEMPHFIISICLSFIEVHSAHAITGKSRMRICCHEAVCSIDVFQLSTSYSY